ncbi:hypothetical protein I7I50_10339 [Histoplasma capsulatum G186AR]|uniref:Uncharacterized protein n=1 Tax=Ajellomyces capsulatus TaxID=5037 RepID=A0A8H7Z9C9_AJECA|nr:hypothetical protein I7I52_01578 [Histoplasma capsulatum]QSS69150.1 hypothetical protein I7I50_10339 [Histoplasma capsulatum G186AR]
MAQLALTLSVTGASWKLCWANKGFSVRCDDILHGRGGFGIRTYACACACTCLGCGFGLSLGWASGVGRGVLLFSASCCACVCVCVCRAGGCGGCLQGARGCPTARPGFRPGLVFVGVVVAVHRLGVCIGVVRIVDVGIFSSGIHHGLRCGAAESCHVLSFYFLLNPYRKRMYVYAESRGQGLTLALLM